MLSHPKGISYQELHIYFSSPKNFLYVVVKLPAEALDPETMGFATPQK